MGAERRNTMQDILFIFKKHSKDMIIFALILLCLILAIYNIFKEDENIDTINTDLITNEEESVEEETKEEPIAYYVDIKGAVENPGVYEVKDGTIISDVIALAGGLKENAYEEGINLSKKVSDEMVIYIYTDSEVKESIAKNPTTNSNKQTQENACNSSSYDITDCVTLTESVIIPGNGNNNTNTDTEETNKIVNINTATKDELVTLSGIGDAKAQEIIEYRKTNGYFTSIEDILNVKGIGDAIFAKIKDFIAV